MAVRAPVKGRKEGGAEETKEGNGEKREGEGIMGKGEGREGVQDSGTLFKLRRVETSITGGAAAAEPPGTDLTVVPLLPIPPTPSTRTSRARARIRGDPSERTTLSVEFFKRRPRYYASFFAISLYAISSTRVNSRYGRRIR